MKLNKIASLRAVAVRRTNVLLPAFLASLSLSACEIPQRCYQDADCPTTQICSQTGACTFMCTSNADCGAGFICNTSHLCVIKPVPPECSKDEDCAEGFVCTDERCIAQEHPCRTNADCEPPKICSPEAVCRLECEHDPDCSAGFECKNNICAPKTNIQRTCPQDMALIDNTYCMDRYEASRPDATAQNAGQDDSRAQSAPGVMPWRLGPDNAKAQAACVAAHKRLCTAAEWENACKSAQNFTYPYGNEYQAAACNGIDTYSISGFHLAPTATHAACHNAQGVYDLSGNLWEHTAQGSGQTVRGGAFNCADSRTNHRCDYVPRTWTPSALGFRCCAEPSDGPQTQAFFLRGKFPPTPKPRSERGFWATPSAGECPRNAPPPTDVNRRSPYFTPVAILAQEGTELTPNTMNPAQAEAFLHSIEQDWHRDDYQAALQKLKDVQHTHGDNPEIMRALGVSYAGVDNYPWSMRVLRTLIRKSPTDCQTLAWLVWVTIGMADLDAAEALLREELCEGSPYAARLAALSAYSAFLLQDRSLARTRTKRAQSLAPQHESDAAAIQYLARQLGIASGPQMSWQIDIAAGYSSNPMSSAPNDPVFATKSTRGALLEYDARLSLDPLSSGFVRPTFEFRSQGQFMPQNMDYSFFDLNAFLGIVVEGTGIKFGASYHPQGLYILGADRYNKGPLLYYMGHRLELDATIFENYYVFAAYGNRRFRHQLRTRQEFDLGLGAYHPLGYGLGLSWGASYKYWKSDQLGYYDLHGFNASLNLDYRLPFDLRMRLGASYGLEDYPNSAQYFGAKQRRDHTVRGNLQLWTPAWYMMRLGLEGKAARRWSSARDYAYEDYRVMLVLRWAGSLDFDAPQQIKDDLFAIPWELGASVEHDSIRDIIQQDEDVKGSSSCMNQ